MNVKHLLTAGVDEAGRGCLAGPVVASAVIWPEGFQLKGLTDSKKLNANKRASFRKKLEETLPKGSWAIGVSSSEEIDKINILEATFLAMHRAIAKLKPKPNLLLIDGNGFRPYLNITYRCEIKGDARFQAISAASIFAKTYRDQIMLEAHLENPQYEWIANKGYPSRKHKIAMMKYGLSKIHRKSFKWQNPEIKKDLEINE